MAPRQPTETDALPGMEMDTPGSKTRFHNENEQSKTTEGRGFGHACFMQSTAAKTCIYLEAGREILLIYHQ